MSGTEGWQLAEVNVARLREPLESPSMAGLIKALGDVNWLADKSPGFAWRHKPDEGPLTLGPLSGAGVVVITLSVWDTYEALHAYVYRSAHGLFMQRRARWFVPIPGYTTALWWLHEGERPSVEDGVARLEHLRANGSTPRAFSLRHQFGPDGRTAGRRSEVVPVTDRQAP